MRRLCTARNGIAVAVLLTFLTTLLSPASAPPAHAATTFRILQLNLCNSGHASCYSGGAAIPEAQDLIEARRPDVITVNEICESDLAPLQSSMGSTHSVFAHARNNGTGTNYQCTGGRGSYGSAVIAASAHAEQASGSGLYTAQDGTNEGRAYACGKFGGRFWSCTTHLSTQEPTALQQCKQLMNEVLPGLKAQHGALPTVMGGDLNLEYDTADPENAQNCVPSGHFRKGDGDVQHVIAADSFGFVRTDEYGLTHTDHNAFMVTLTAPW